MNNFKIISGEKGSGADGKKSLRAYMKKRRADNANRDVKETLLIENFLKAEQELFSKNEKTAETVKGKKYFIYCSFSSEAPTDKLIETIEEIGGKIYCPRLENGEMQAVEKGEDFSLSSLGIREPVGEAYFGEIDIIVAPLLATDTNGNRLGYGGGYYDRFFKTHKNAKRIGFAFDFQIVESVPCEAWDERLDCIVTDKRIIYIQK